MRKSHNFGILFLLLVVVTGCKFKAVYEKSFDIQKAEWNKKQIATFEVPITDTINGYNIFINVRNSNDYPYSNLYLFINTLSPDSIVMKDTIEVFLADEKGKWRGKGLGGVLSNEAMFKPNVRFPLKGNYRIEIAQAMRDDVLQGIIDVGIRVEKAK